jgi:hypothetical protein
MNEGDSLRARPASEGAQLVSPVLELYEIERRTEAEPDPAPVRFYDGPVSARKGHEEYRNAGSPFLEGAYKGQTGLLIGAAFEDCQFETRSLEGLFKIGGEPRGTDARDTRFCSPERNADRVTAWAVSATSRSMLKVYRSSDSRKAGTPAFPSRARGAGPERSPASAKKSGPASLSPAARSIGSFQYSLSQGMPARSKACRSSSPFSRKKSSCMASRMPCFVNTRSA